MNVYKKSSPDCHDVTRYICASRRVSNKNYKLMNYAQEFSKLFSERVPSSILKKLVNIKTCDKQAYKSQTAAIN